MLATYTKNPIAISWEKKKKIHLTVIENPTFRFDLRCNVFIFLIKVKHFLLKKIRLGIPTDGNVGNNWA